jgi:hypothetical protein
MPRPMCPLCTNDDEVTTLEVLPDGRKRARCAACKFEWDHGEVKEPKKLQIMSEVEARGRFPKASDVDPSATKRNIRLPPQAAGVVCMRLSRERWTRCLITSATARTTAIPLSTPKSRAPAVSSSMCAASASSGSRYSG